MSNQTTSEYEAVARQYCLVHSRLFDHSTVMKAESLFVYNEFEQNGRHQVGFVYWDANRMLTGI
jgi:hypothetical protein